MSTKEQFIDQMDPLVRSCFDTMVTLGLNDIVRDDWEDLPRSESRAAHYDRLERIVGNTPISQLTHIARGSSKILTKLEVANPSGSHYDRAYLKTLRRFEEEGLIRPGDELRDITSGSAGISLAVLGKELGYSVRITVPDELPANRLFPITYFEAEVVNAGAGYIKAASEFQAQEIQSLKDDSAWELIRPADRNQKALIFSNSERRICYLNHSENSLTVEAFQVIGEEAVRQMEEPPRCVVLALGNWTTIAGIIPVMKKAWPDTQIIGYEGENTTVHDNYGTTVSGIPLRFRDDSLVDAKVVITDAVRDTYDEFINRNLTPAMQLGHSSIMGMAAAHTELHDKPGTALTIAYDQKLRY
jgi:cysteine synthase